jgi:hypothetical protein
VLKRVGRAAVGLACSLALAELLVRGLGTTDEDGRFSLFGRPLPPDPIPLASTRRHLAAYLASQESFLVYDPDTGWAPRPGGRSGPFHANADGLRDERDFPEEATPGVLRVAIFGDSYTFGDEVAFADTWGEHLEADLAARGVPAEVLNFGVSAYGMDQAYLRWKQIGRRFHPDVVVFGLQPENALRNLNVFRSLYFHNTGVPLSKPRFVLREGGLEPINLPALPPERVEAALAGLRDDPLGRDDAFLALYPRPWWRHSRLAALVAATLAPELRLDVETLGRSEETRVLARRVLAEFAADARGRGAAFLFAYMPMQSDLRVRLRGGTPWDEDIVRDAGAIAPVVGLGSAVAPLRDDDFHPGGHWAARLDRAIAAALVEPVLAAACADTARRGSLPACTDVSRTASPGSRSRPATAPPSPP